MVVRLVENDLREEGFSLALQSSKLTVPVQIKSITKRALQFVFMLSEGVINGKGITDQTNMDNFEFPAADQEKLISQIVSAFVAEQFKGRPPGEQLRELAATLKEENVKGNKNLKIRVKTGRSGLNDSSADDIDLNDIQFTNSQFEVSVSLANEIGTEFFFTFKELEERNPAELGLLSQIQEFKESLLAELSVFDQKAAAAATSIITSPRAADGNSSSHRSSERIALRLEQLQEYLESAFFSVKQEAAADGTQASILTMEDLVHKIQDLINGCNQL